MPPSESSEEEIIRQLVAPSNAIFPHALRDRAYEAPNGMLAWRFQDAEAALRVLESTGAAAMGAVLWADDGQGRGATVLPVVDGEVKFHSWKCPMEAGEAWADYVRRAATVARDNLPAATRVGSELGHGYVPYIRFEWVFEEQPGLFDLPPAVRHMSDDAAMDGGALWGPINWAGLNLGPDVRRACPTAPGSFYGREQATSFAHVPRSAAYLSVAEKAKDLEQLAEFKKLETLKIVGVGKAELADIGRVSSLRLLSLSRIRATNLKGLEGLHRLEHLECDDSATLTNLGALSSLDRLRTLTLVHLRKLAYLKEASRLTQLRGLAVRGSMWTAARVPNLVPLEKLRDLRSLQLAGVRVADGSLRPLTTLNNLRFLTLANWFRIEEFAELAVAFPDIEGGGFQSMWWIPPHAAKPGEYDLCKRCKAFKPGLSIGKPMRELCPRCDEAQIAKLSTRWAALVQAGKDRPKVPRSRSAMG